MVWLRRVWAHRKLWRGQCRVCSAALRDDQRLFCSEACAHRDAAEEQAW